MVNIHRNFILLSLLLLHLCISTPAHTANQKSYTVGIVPQFEATKLYRIWKPILDRLEVISGVQLKLVGSSSIPEFEKSLHTGLYDFAYMNPFHLLIANEEEGYIPLIRDKEKKLSGILTVRKNGPIHSVKDLQGKVIAFPSPNALGASLQMRAELTDKFHISFEPVYVKSHDSVYLNVLLRQAAAGGGVQKTFNRQKPAVKSALEILYRTEPVAPHPVAAHPRVPLDVQQKIIRAFIAMGNSESDREMLEKIPMKKIGKATMADYLPLKKMNLKRFYNTK